MKKIFSIIFLINFIFTLIAFAQNEQTPSQNSSCCCGEKCDCNPCSCHQANCPKDCKCEKPCRCAPHQEKKTPPLSAKCPCKNKPQPKPHPLPKPLTFSPSKQFC